MVLEEGVTIELEFDHFRHGSHKGLDKDYFADIKDLIRMVGGISNVAEPSLIAMLHTLRCVRKTFKCTLSIM